LTRVGWVDCSSGVSGDMLLGALTALDTVDVDALARELGLGGVASATVQRGGISARAVTVEPEPDQPHRRLADVLGIVDRAPVPAQARTRAAAVFHRLAEAEADVHGVAADDVEFHEVGAVDSIVDIVGACTGLHALGLDELVVAPIALGGGTASTAHGPVPVPVPAVLALLAATSLASYGGPADVELATPTGVALLAEWATTAGQMPAMHVEDVGVGAGQRELAARPNVLRLVVGRRADINGHSAGESWHVLEANVDDLDPRLWPVVIDRLLAAGAADAWVTPIVMKKGRPAHTVSALCGQATLSAVEAALFAETSTIGVRRTEVAKTALDREWMPVQVAGQTIRVKVARRAGTVVNVSPEFDDVVRAAAALDRSVKSVLAAAAAAAHAALP